MDSKLKKGNSPGQPWDRKRTCLKALLRVYYVLRKYPHANLDNGILSKLGIKVTSSLDEAKPRFFEPFDNDTFEKLWAQAEIAAQADPEYDFDWPTFYLANNAADVYHLYGFLDSLCGRRPEPRMMLDQYGPWKARTYVSLNPCPALVSKTNTTQHGQYLPGALPWLCSWGRTPLHNSSRVRRCRHWVPAPRLHDQR
jgi:hypothetical protein